MYTSLMTFSTRTMFIAASIFALWALGASAAPTVEATTASNATDLMTRGQRNQGIATVSACTAENFGGRCWDTKLDVGRQDGCFLLQPVRDKVRPPLLSINTHGNPSCTMHSYVLSPPHLPALPSFLCLLWHSRVMSTLANIYGASQMPKLCYV